MPTRLENPDPNNDGSPVDADDFDEDGTPDYLDDDDDEDGVLTRDEENNTQDQDPTNDQSQSDENNVNRPDYLNAAIATTVPATAFRTHEIQRSFTVSLRVTDISIDFISQDNFDFGLLTGASQLTGAARDTIPVFPPVFPPTTLPTN